MALVEAIPFAIFVHELPPLEDFINPRKEPTIIMPGFDGAKETAEILIRTNASLMDPHVEPASLDL